jgi:hypothetical protein
LDFKLFSVLCLREGIKKFIWNLLNLGKAFGFLKYNYAMNISWVAHSQVSELVL